MALLRILLHQLQLSNHLTKCYHRSYRTSTALQELVKKLVQKLVQGIIVVHGMLSVWSVRYRIFYQIIAMYFCIKMCGIAKFDQKIALKELLVTQASRRAGTEASTWVNTCRTGYYTG